MTSHDWMGLGLLLSVVLGWVLQPYANRFAQRQARPPAPRCPDCGTKLVSPGICAGCDRRRRGPQPHPPAFGPKPMTFCYDNRSYLQQQYGPMAWNAPFSEAVWQRLRTTEWVYFALHTGDPGPTGRDNRAKGNPDFLVVRIKFNGDNLRSITCPTWTNRDGVDEKVTHASVWFDAYGGSFAYSFAFAPTRWFANTMFTMTSASLDLTISYDPNRGYLVGSR